MINEEANKDSLPGLINQLRQRVMRDIEKSLPCQIEKVNSDRTRVTVKPLITMIDNSGNRLSRQSIQNNQISHYVIVYTHNTSKCETF